MSVTVQGEWIECRLEECNKMFFQHILGHKYYSLSDKLGVCPLCISEKQLKSGTILKARNVIVEYHKYHAKPGSDTL